MKERRISRTIRPGIALVASGLVLLGGCTSERAGQTTAPPSETQPTTAPSSAAANTATPTQPTSSVPSTATTTVSATPAASSEPTAATTTSAPRRTTTTTTEPRRRPTTTTEPPLPVHNPECVVEVEPGESLSLIAESVPADVVTVATLQAENGIADPDLISAGEYLDICVRNRINDVTGDRRVRRRRPPPPTAGGPIRGTGVEAQQQQLNALFFGSGLPPLAVDGYSGPLTQQQLCAARVALGLPISRADVVPGSDEEQVLMSATSLSIPWTAPVAPRWILIDQTCQIMFVGENSERIVYVFQTSTGEAGYETRDQNGSRVFRFDPARENGGWHDSIDYPSELDNPLNGNMYMPLYFDDGQAIHGANNVPPEPASKGCARLQVASQDLLVGWLGLADEPAPVWDSAHIDLTVSVQGRY